ncbi:hypothetical protein M446_4955 [Methylobacterium sp. 4-46]|nr:hypothetical protein M446_4955 [Methylobacterium sp. 4-46]
MTVLFCIIFIALLIKGKGALRNPLHILGAAYVSLCVTMIASIALQIVGL